jgi:hypothetical protein
MGSASSLGIVELRSMNRAGKDDETLIPAARRPVKRQAEAVVQDGRPGVGMDGKWVPIYLTKEKRILGELWERRSGGTGLFIMPRGRDWEAIRRKKATGI